MHYLTILKFPHLQSINVGYLSCFKELAMLIENTKGDISDIDRRLTKIETVLIMNKMMPAELAQVDQANSGSYIH